MNQQRGLCSNILPLIDRRSALKSLSLGFGWLAFSRLASEALGASNDASKLHFPAKAKRVIFMCMRGGPSHVDTFDYKPQLIADNGKPGRRKGTQLLAPVGKFSQRGESGLWISDLIPNIATQADKLCIWNAMSTDVPAHPQAFLTLHTGSARFVRPSLGAWTLYGLGKENENLPGFVTVAPTNNNGGSQNYGSSFLPASFQATRIGGEGRFAEGAKVPYLRRSQTIDAQRKELDLLQSFNRAQLEAQGSIGTPDSAAVEGLIESFELGYRMQTDLTQVINMDNETDDTLKMYGIDQPESADFGRKCLFARRLIESGVRFVEVTHGNWDHHNNLKDSMETSCRSIDKPAAGLLQDLAQRGLLDETLVIWSGEFGRTPHSQGTDGRDHNNLAFSSWMAGGGVRGGMTYGVSDEYGYEGIEQQTNIHDWHATILRLLGLDHTKLTYKYAGRDFRLTDVYGNIINDVIG